MSGIVALDADSVLYLFNAPEALNFLLSRHPISPLDSSSVAAFAPIALELSGHASGSSRVVSAIGEAGPQLRRALEQLGGKSSLIVPMGMPRPTEWQVFLGRTEPAFVGRHDFLSEIWIQRDGRVSIVRDSMVSPPRIE